MSHDAHTLRLEQGSPDGYEIDNIPYSFKHLVCARKCVNFVNHAIEMDVADTDYQPNRDSNLPRDLRPPKGPYAPSITEMGSGFKVGEIPYVFRTRTNARIVADTVTHYINTDANDPGFKGIRAKGLWLEHGPAWADFT